MTSTQHQRHPASRRQRSARSVRVTLLASAMCIAGSASAQQGPSPEQRAQVLVAQMTVEEKASLLLNTAPAIPRLKISAYQWWNEGLHGVAGDPLATNFPEPIGLAAMFDAPLLNRIATSITHEAAEIGDRKIADGFPQELGAGRNLWSPNINIFRDPRWGRGQETYGEDPFLTARLGIAYVTGIQGSNAASPINIATPKHFAVHSGPEPTRHQDDVSVSLHDLRDTYLPAFRAAVIEGRAGGIMCAYNSINGEPACANNFLLGTTLRGAWGFKGIVVSDCEAIADIWQKHKFAPDAVAASAVSVRAGMDNECTGDGFFDPTSFGRSASFVSAVKDGKLPMAALDRAVVRNLAVRIRTGSLDRTSGSSRLSASRTISPNENRALALNAAEKSLVLLKNDGLLPLGGKRLKIAVVGPLADARRVMRGNYTSRESSAFPSIVDGLRQAFPDADIRYVPAAPSITDGDVIPTTALQRDDGKPGLTVRYFPVLPTPGPGPRSILEKVVRFTQSKFATEPSKTEIVPVANFESFGSRILPAGGKAVATGFLVPQVSGTYRLGLRGLASDLTFDGKPLVSVPIAAALPTIPVLKTVKLEAGKRYPITLTMMVPNIHFAELDWQRVSDQPEQDLAASTRDADVIVAVVGITSSLESEEGTQDLSGFKAGDRTSLDLPQDQRKLLEAAKATERKLVVVNMSGSAINLEWAKINANAVIQAWYPGEAGGIAVGRTIAGLVNPAGRLPVTFYRDTAQLPPIADYAMTGRTYRYFKGVPVYPFGYGLSYTSFAYAPVRVSSRGKGARDGVIVETEVTNKGVRSGDEVAQLYVDFPDAPGVPNIALRGFQRITLAPGESRKLRFELSPRDLSSVSPEGDTRVLSGRYGVHVGGGQPDSGLPGASASVTVAVNRVLPQ